MSKFLRNDEVRIPNGETGIVREIFISYPKFGDHIEHSAPQIHYRVALDVDVSFLYQERELNDPRQMEMKLEDSEVTITETGTAAEEDDYHNWYL